MKKKNVPLVEVPPGITDDEFYKGDFLPELTAVPPTSVDSDMSALKKTLWDGGGWRKSEQDKSTNYRRGY